MKKKQIALILVGIMALSTIFTGCGKKNNTTPETQVEANTETSTEENTETEETTVALDDDTLEEFITDDDISMEDLAAAVVLCDYSNLDIDVKLEEVTEEHITNEMNEYLAFFDSYEHLMEGTVEEGKTANITYVGTMDGEEFDGGSGTFDLEIGSNSFIDGFEDGLIGSEVGDEVTLDLTFPEDYYAENLAGKAVQFDVMINYLLGDKIEAELTDEFLSSNADYDSVQELHDAVQLYLEGAAINTYKVDRENRILDYIIQNSEVPKIPRKLIDDYVDNMRNYYQGMADLYGMDLSSLLESNMGVTVDEFNRETKQSAINYMQSAIVLSAVALKEDIDVTEEEVNEYIAQFAESNGYSSADELIQALEENEEMDEMNNEVLYNKVMIHLYESNNIALPEGVEEAYNEKVAEAEARDKARKEAEIAAIEASNAEAETEEVGTETTTETE